MAIASMPGLNGVVRCIPGIEAASDDERRVISGETMAFAVSSYHFRYSGYG